MVIPILAGGDNRLDQTRSKTPMLDSQQEIRKPIYCLVQMCEVLDGGEQDCTPWQKVYPGRSHTFQDGKNFITVIFDTLCTKSFSGRTEKRTIGFPTQKIYRSQDLVLGAISRLFEPGRAPDNH
ncbi:hypothetical protein PspLS_00104 [Pyricularia sp. CBS 133598]|nr:hypothetical protein PspLS_00104 [Pyricularia sp. CBS 133598]